MIIFVNILLDKQIVTSETFTATLLMAVGSTMLSVPLVTPKLRRLASLIGKPAAATPERSTAHRPGGLGPLGSC